MFSLDWIGDRQSKNVGCGAFHTDDTHSFRNAAVCAKSIQDEDGGLSEDGSSRRLEYNGCGKAQALAANGMGVA
ncbi:MAG: hypothetical protein WDN02_00995 [Methylovirgula sp.]|uniref:hypothetical protein n=1 Tax=Methylovirgula sp. TaxID=1978224 RepID=UPI00307631F2